MRSLRESVDMSGKTCLVTGANSGIGLETARGLARLGARVIMVCRDPEKGAAARRDIISTTGNESLGLLIADMASMGSIRALAESIKSEHPALHVLINNAGLLTPERQTSADGYELQFAVNYLAPFLLTHLLLDLLKAGAPSRVVNVASMIHRFGDYHFDDLQNSGKYSAFKVYGQSKLAMIRSTYDFAEKLRGTGVTVNCLHPGGVSTNIAGTPDWMRIFLATPEKGARTSLYVATAPELETVTGHYFNRCKARKTSRRSYDAEAGRRLWEISESLCGLAPAAP